MHGVALELVQFETKAWAKLMVMTIHGIVCKIVQALMHSIVAPHCIIRVMVASKHVHIPASCRSQHPMLCSLSIQVCLAFAGYSRSDTATCW